MINKRMGFLAVALVAMGLGMGCIDDVASTAGSVSLYFYDDASDSVKVWDGADIAFEQSAPEKPDREITGTQFDKDKGLTVGGLAFDDSNNCLYLLFKSGKMVRIDRVRSQNGDLSSSSDVVSFKLDSSKFLDGTNQELTQLTIDSGQGALYIAEKSDSQGRFWYVPDAARKTSLDVIAPSEINTTENTKCTGVAAFNSALYAYYGGGDPIADNSSPSKDLSGARLRMGAASGWMPRANVFVYPDDTLGNLGSLALDRDNNVLYLCRQQGDALMQPPILAYETKDFSTGFSFKGYRELGKASECPGMKFITHAGSQDWLAGAGGNGNIYMWKNAKDGQAFKALSVSGAQIMGLAFDGNR